MLNKVFVVLFFGVIISCSTEESVRKNEFLSINGQSFVDGSGRQVILNGLNYISKDPNENYIRNDGPELFERFKNYGFNVIRLGIIWDGLEPEPGKYNEEYLAEIDQRIKWAAENEIYVFLDMHQDLYGSKFSDGAPEWATMDEGKPHYTGSVWSDSYLISPAVQTAFDNFWKNTPASDGVGIQDHYANLWKHIAKRYVNNTTVIGYDIMNEPFMGSTANDIMPLMLSGFAQVFAEETGTEPPAADELANMWADEETRLEALKFIESKDRYSRVIDGVYELNAAFERNELQQMYQKVAKAIREVDNNHILFLEHSYFSNTGVSSAIEPTKLSDGTTDPLVAYAAHGYDLVVDTKEVENPSYERVEFIFDRIRQTGERMNVPVLIGEWGAYHGKSIKMVETAQHVVNLFESYGFSNTYWCYYDDIEQYPYFRLALIRPFPQRVNGSLISYDFNFKTGEFVASWEELGKNTEPSIIYVPELRNVLVNEVNLNPFTDEIIFDYSDKTNAGKLHISPLGKDTKRTLSFVIRPEQL